MIVASSNAKKMSKFFLAIFLFLIIGCGSDIVGDDPKITINSPVSSIKTTKQLAPVKGSAIAFTKIKLNATLNKNQVDEEALLPQEVSVADNGLWETTITIGDPIITKDIAVTIFATTLTGGEKSNEVNFTRTPEPKITIKAPVDGSTTTDQDITVQGSATPGIPNINLQITIGSTSSTQNNLVVAGGLWATKIPVGDITITQNIVVTILATDDTGKVASEPLTFTRIPGSPAL